MNVRLNYIDYRVVVSVHINLFSVVNTDILLTYGRDDILPTWPLQIFCSKLLNSITDFQLVLAFETLLS